MCSKRGLWYKFIALALALVLVVPILVACGGGNGGEDTATPEVTPSPKSTATKTVVPTLTPTASATSTPTPTTSPGALVKIGAIMSWSGPLGASGFLADQVVTLVDKKVKDRGGILGGRELKIVKYDDRSALSQDVAGATKLVKEDNVSALAWGGATAASINAVASAAEELKVLYASISSPSPGRLENELKYTVLPAPSAAANYDDKANLIINKLKPKTLAWLYLDDAELNKQINLVDAQTEPAGIKTVYKELVSGDTVDLMPYLTQIKHLNPDVLVLGLMAPQALTAAKQILELGGWGTTQVLGITSTLEAAKMPGAVGWIVETAWVTGLDYPASRQFEEDFKAANNGKTPTLNHIWFYNPLWTIIEAIEMAGTTDREAIAKAARSGNLQWDTPCGMAHFNPDGNSGLDFTYVRILQGGKTELFK